MIRVTVTVTVYPSVYRHEGYPVDVSYAYYVRVQLFTRGVRFIIEQSYIFQRMFSDFTACFCYWQVLASFVYSARILRFQLIRFHLSPTLEFLTHLQTVDSKRYLLIYHLHTLLHCVSWLQSCPSFPRIRSAFKIYVQICGHILQSWLS